jgi:hypothetical protein
LYWNLANVAGPEPKGAENRKVSLLLALISAKKTLRHATAAPIVSIQMRFSRGFWHCSSYISGSSGLELIK